MGSANCFAGLPMLLCSRYQVRYLELSGNVNYTELGASRLDLRKDDETVGVQP